MEEAAPSLARLLSGSQTKKSRVVIVSDELPEETFFNSYERLPHLMSDPTNDYWVFPALYKDDVNGRRMIWRIGYDSTRLRFIHGYVGGTLQTDEVLVEAKRGLTIQEQALQEARRKYQDKFEKENYRPLGDLTPKEVPVMRGEHYKEGMLNRWPVAVEAKLDGVHVRITRTQDGLRYLSKGNKVFPHLHHLDDELLIYFTYLPPEIMLHGELLIPETCFDVLSGILRAPVNIDPRVSEVQVFVFDFYLEDPMPFEDRYNLLVRAYQVYLQDEHINTKFFLLCAVYAWSHEELMELHAHFESQGYEGIMIKKIAGLHPTEKELTESLYRKGKGSNILKYKRFLDGEAVITDVKEGKGRCEGKAIFQARWIPPGWDKAVEFDVKKDGSDAGRRKWFEQPSLVLGKLLNFTYQGVTQYGRPRFPVGRYIRDFE